MHKILIIDDDPKRLNKIKELLESKFSDIQIHVADSVHNASKKLKNNYYFSIFLDMSLPLRSNEKKLDRNAGIKLLEQISRGRFKKIPIRVVGFTALIEDFENKEEQFESLGFRLYEAKPGDFSWFNRALKQVEYSLNSLESYNDLPTDIAVFSVHGIETNGKWQDDLISLIRKRFPEADIVDLPFKFEEFPVTRFIIPWMRNNMVDLYFLQLEKWLEENKTKRIVCFAHSFGTYILVKALERIKNKSLLENLDLVLLSGSVLKQNYDFRAIKEFPNVRIVNDCARQDGALLFSKGVVWGTGMGGRLGFSSILNQQFVNRTYEGGHSVFFEKDNKIVKEYWLPLLDNDFLISPFNKVSRNRKRDKLFEYTARLSGSVKLLYYVFPLLALCYIFVTFLNIIWP
ncbi:Response regulator receiver domain protein [Pseudoalteromonas sp. P1-9]|uniref:response regulator n=1 Tax=Pseudoalteromonas sp. P1-9 TaxID=1710354 RepID=UPI0006D5FEA8|nr:response regulator [Pseudoalteromonas sp. P1-9]KPV95328.1 Response regulator receiver domain protein [Pseudoalteromonas sp. P1-9]